jgi:CDP-glycerol glycerophosphotransferase (TagB/SpsB family)
LRKEGFNLIKFGGLNHLSALMNCKYFLSSHLDKYVTTYYGKKFTQCMQYKFIYFGHGIFKDDLSNYLLNRSSLIDCFTRATKQEYYSIINDFSPYTLTKKEVILTGLPRYDNLFDLSVSQENMIVFMPTWRNKIVGDINPVSNTRAKVKSFLKSEYAKNIISFLSSDRLHELLSVTNYQFFFFPHVNIQPYLSDMKIPEPIICLKHGDIDSIQTLFKKTKILITDYSSVAFDAALIERVVIYFQFDKKSIYSGSHLYKKGYYSYENNGFGPVIETESDMIEYIKVCIANNCRIEYKYLQRIYDTFKFRDMNNCERVFKAVQNLCPDM